MTLLYLDVDGRLPPNLCDRITMACRLWQWPLVAVRLDRTQRGWHVVIGIERQLAPALVVAAQAVLGSDTNREMFNLMRVVNLPNVSRFWRNRWNVLYERHSRPRRPRVCLKATKAFGSKA